MASILCLSVPCFFALIFFFFFFLAHPDLAWFHPLILLFCQWQCESKQSCVAQPACQSPYHLWPGSGYCLSSVYLSIELLAIGSSAVAHARVYHWRGLSLSAFAHICLCVFHRAHTHTDTRCPLKEWLAPLIADISLVFPDLKLLLRLPPTAAAPFIHHHARGDKKRAAKR